MNIAYIGLGTNLGNRKANILAAYAEISKRIGTIEKKSSFYKTPPWGFDSDEDFLNSVILLKTELDIFTLLDELKKIESYFGREINSKKKGYQDRPIDLDIIDFNGKIYETEKITVPHKQLHLRNFVLLPLEEIAPNWFHPILKKSIKLINNSLQNTEKIEKLD